MLPLDQIDACIVRLSDVIREAVYYAPRGQVTRPQRYQMTPATESELKRIVANFNEALEACRTENETNLHAIEMASRFFDAARRKSGTSQ